MKILNLFAGIGGNRKLWTNHEVTSIEKDSNIANIYKKRFSKDTIIIGDVWEFVLNKKNDLDYFDFIWASPPCQTHSQMQKFNPNKEKRQPIPKLDQTIGFYFWLKQNFRNKFVIENTQPWYKTLLTPVRLDRHLFWSNFPITKTKKFNIAGSNKHGKIGGVMRDDNKKNMYDFAKYLQCDDVFEDIIALKGYRHRTIIRNHLNPKIGKYIITQAEKGIKLNKFIIN